MNKRWVVILLFLPLALFLYAREDIEKDKNDSIPIYQGVNVKLDIAMPIIEAARSAGKIQDYEMAINVRLKNRFIQLSNWVMRLRNVGQMERNTKGMAGLPDWVWIWRLSRKVQRIIIC